jgi:hypothetical protein
LPTAGDLSASQRNVIAALRAAKSQKEGKELLTKKGFWKRLFDGGKAGLNGIIQTMGVIQQTPWLKGLIGAAVPQLSPLLSGDLFNTIGTAAADTQLKYVAESLGVQADSPAIKQYIISTSGLPIDVTDMLYNEYVYGSNSSKLTVNELRSHILRYQRGAQSVGEEMEAYRQQRNTNLNPITRLWRGGGVDQKTGRTQHQRDQEQYWIDLLQRREAQKEAASGSGSQARGWFY